MAHFEVTRAMHSRLLERTRYAGFTQDLCRIYFTLCRSAHAMHTHYAHAMQSMRMQDFLPGGAKKFDYFY